MGGRAVSRKEWRRIMSGGDAVRCRDALFCAVDGLADEGCSKAAKIDRLLGE